MFNDDFDYYQSQFERLLEDYSLEEILDLGEMTPSEVLAFLYLEGKINLPDIKPLDAQ